MLSALTQRSGAMHIRVGGNSQEGAVLSESVEKGKVIVKDYTKITGTVSISAVL